MSEQIPKILLCGRLRSGKSLAAGYLATDYGFTEISFGGMLKYFAEKLFIHSIAKSEGKPRKVYQDFGQACRTVDENIWVQHAHFAYKMALDSRTTRGIVCSDGRQPNELAWAKEQGFVIVRVTAPEAVRLERAKRAGDAFELADLAHETESYVDTFEADYIINNAGTLAELFAQLDEIITEIKRKGVVE